MIPFLLAITMSAKDTSIDHANLVDKIDALWPGPEEEKWMEVGWRLDLFAARQEASNKNKPVFMWMMNGHPTGCT
jgi:hypothetical protein